MRFNTLDQWLDWQTSLHVKTIDLTLERVSQVYQQLAIKKVAPIVITVAGTNGKGSTVAMLEAILVAANFKVGSYTSPHLLHYNERVKINGQPVTDEQLCLAFETVDQARGDTSLTYFEFGTLASYVLFSQSALDVVILETGLGGRLDAVNILDADVAVITSIDLDHLDWLGPTREHIAIEKLGIARSGKPLVLTDTNPPQNVEHYIAQHQIPCYQLGVDYGYNVTPESWSWWGANPVTRKAPLPFPALRGTKQLDNAATCLQVLSLLRQQLPVSQQDIRLGLQAVTLGCRFQVRHGTNGATEILDVAHNPEAARVLAANLRSMSVPGKTFAVVGMLKDKLIEGTLAPLVPMVDHWFLCDMAGERGASASVLVETLHGLSVDENDVSAFSASRDAYIAAGKLAKDNDRIVIFGSFYLVSNFLDERR